MSQPVVVRVLATDGLPIEGVTVTFAAANGGGAGSPTDVSDANGLAQTTWTLGPVGGVPQSLTATVAGVTGSPVTFTATSPALALLHHYPMNVDVSDAVGSEDGTLQFGAVVADGVLTPGGVNGTVEFGALGSVSTSRAGESQAAVASIAVSRITCGRGCKT